MARSSDTEGNSNEHGISALRIALRSFNSQWFLIPQGSGIVAITLHQLHYQFQGLGVIANIFWVITIHTLIGFLLIYFCRATLFPRHVASQYTSNFMETACLCSISIAFTTIIQMIALTLTPSWGPGWGMAAYVMWWINVVMAAVACIATFHILTKVDGPGISSVPPGALLPSIAALTIAAGGGVACRYGAISASLQAPVIIVGYLFIGIGLPLAVIIDPVILTRFFDRAFPMKQQVYQLMMLCGPLGQGSFALQILGTCVQRGAFAQYNTSSFISATGASTIATSSQPLGPLTWGYGIFWWAYACIAILHYIVADPKALLKWDQTLSIWSLIFPWGVFTNAAVQLGDIVLNSQAFWIWSTILTIFLVMLWLAVSLATVVGVLNGRMLGLDRGWRAVYHESSAEREKEQQEKDQQEKQKQQSDGRDHEESHVVLHESCSSKFALIVSSNMTARRTY